MLNARLKDQNVEEKITKPREKNMIYGSSANIRKKNATYIHDVS